MLYGNFGEARQPDADWTVRLPDDNPEALAKLLPVMHGRFADFDPRLDEHELVRYYDIAVIADKYDLTHLLRPWADELLQSLGNCARAPGLDLQTLWVSWVFGSSVTFDSVVRRLAWETPSDEPYYAVEPVAVFGEYPNAPACKRPSHLASDFPG